MRIDLPQCNFKECRYCSDHNCRDKTRYDSCMFKYYAAAYEKLIKEGNFEDQKYPEIPGYYILLVWNKQERRFADIGGRWNKDKGTFEGVDTEKYTIIAWQRCT